ncbi:MULTISPECIES: hypothetical protein [Streptomyces]|uniref:hypothetical protein n=1 Tax=Streptomyces albidoflavus TaxID=1886 RepID=UPI0033F21AA4
MPKTTDTRTTVPAPDPDAVPSPDPDTPGTAVPVPRPPRRALAAAVAIAGGTSAAALGTLAGLWFMPFLAGAAAGLTSRFARTAARRSRGYLTAPFAAVLGWAIPLGVQALGGAPVGEVARTTAALAGLPPLAAAVVAATLLIALVQALLGVWVGRTLAPRGRTTADLPAPTRPSA